MASSALNAGVDSAVVAKTTNHKDPKSLQVYYEVDGNSKVKSALAVGKVINTDNKKRKRVLDDEEDDLIEEDFSNDDDTVVDNNDEEEGDY